MTEYSGPPQPPQAHRPHIFLANNVLYEPPGPITIAQAAVTARGTERTGKVLFALNHRGNLPDIKKGEYTETDMVTAVNRLRGEYPTATDLRAAFERIIGNLGVDAAGKAPELWRKQVTDKQDQYRRQVEPFLQAMITVYQQDGAIPTGRNRGMISNNLSEIEIRAKQLSGPEAASRRQELRRYLQENLAALGRFSVDNSVLNQQQAIQIVGFAQTAIDALTLDENDQLRVSLTQIRTQFGLSLPESKGQEPKKEQIQPVAIIIDGKPLAVTPLGQPNSLSLATLNPNRGQQDWELTDVGFVLRAASNSMGDRSVAIIHDQYIDPNVEAIEILQLDPQTLTLQWKAARDMQTAGFDRQVLGQGQWQEQPVTIPQVVRVKKRGDRETYFYMETSFKATNRTALDIVEVRPRIQQIDKIPSI